MKNFRKSVLPTFAAVLIGLAALAAPAGATALSRAVAPVGVVIDLNSVPIIARDINGIPNSSNPYWVAARAGDQLHSYPLLSDAALD